MIISLLPDWLRPWRCRCCGAPQDALLPICLYTNIPRDFR